MRSSNNNEIFFKQCKDLKKIIKIHVKSSWETKISRVSSANVRWSLTCSAVSLKRRLNMQTQKTRSYSRIEKEKNILTYVMYSGGMSYCQACCLWAFAVSSRSTRSDSRRGRSWLQGGIRTTVVSAAKIIQRIISGEWIDGISRPTILLFLFTLALSRANFHMMLHDIFIPAAGALSDKERPGFVGRTADLCRLPYEKRMTRVTRSMPGEKKEKKRKKGKKQRKEKIRRDLSVFLLIFSFTFRYRFPLLLSLG